MGGGWSRADNAEREGEGRRHREAQTRGREVGRGGDLLGERGKGTGRGEQPGKEERRVGAEPWRDHTGKGKTSERQRGKQTGTKTAKNKKKRQRGKGGGEPQKRCGEGFAILRNWN